LWLSAAKISTEQTSQLGSHSNYMKKLLSIVRERMQESVIDITMKFTLSALWNLTDESPKTCKVKHLGICRTYLCTSWPQITGFGFFLARKSQSSIDFSSALLFLKVGNLKHFFCQYFISFFTFL
jgi:hypothetical protein